MSLQHFLNFDIGDKMRIDDATFLAKQANFTIGNEIEETEMILYKIESEV
jgi:hypothetical protein